MPRLATICHPSRATRGDAEARLLVKHTVLLLGLVSIAGACRRESVRPDPGMHLSRAARDKIKLALGGVPWTPATLAALDAYTASWNASDKGTPASSLRRRCLDRARARFEALAEQLESPLDASARVAAPLAIAGLPAAAYCEHLTDDAELAMPATPADRARTEMFEHDLALAWAAFAIGRTTAARTIIASDKLGLSKLQLHRLTAEHLALEASLEARARNREAARARFTEALWEATQAASPGLVRMVWLQHLDDDIATDDPDVLFDVGQARLSGVTDPALDLFEGDALRSSGDTAGCGPAYMKAVLEEDKLSPLHRAAAELGWSICLLDPANGSSLPSRRAADALKGISVTRDYMLAIVGDGHPELARFEDAFALAERTRGHLRDSLAHSNRALALRGASPESLLVRAATYLEAGDITNARADALHARELGSPREANTLLGDIFTASGSPDEASAYYDLAGAKPASPPTLPNDPAALEAQANALPNEPSRTALATWIALARAAHSPQAARAAISLYQAMPQLGRGATYDEMWALSKQQP
jgi:hypothetical protein